MNFQNIMLVLLGSGLGGVLRYMVEHFHGQLSDASRHFVPILIVNVIGSLLIGIAFALLSKQLLSDKASLFIMTGLLGGFTTYSSFSLDSMKLIQNGQVMTALVYILTSLVLGVVAVFVGYWLGQSVG